MMSSPDPENVLSAALRAQAAGGAAPDTPQAPPPPPQPAPQQVPAEQVPVRRLPVRGVLVFALVLGLAAGVVVAIFTVTGVHVL